MIKINLLPKELQERGKSLDWIIVGYGLIVLVFMILFLSYFKNLSQYKKDLHKKELWGQQLSAIQAKVAKVTELDEQKNSLNAKKNTVVELFQTRLFYPKLMESFYRTLPKEIWVSDLAFSEEADKKIKVVAMSEATNTDSIADWLQILEAKKEMFSDVVLSSIEAKPGSNGRQATYTFSMTFIYHPPKEAM